MPEGIYVGAGNLGRIVELIILGTGGEETTSGCRSTGARSETTGISVGAYVHLVSCEEPAHVVIHSRSV